ncbi:hypothetical protein CWE09_03875 [Aliidiomarina minuta]|uniref:Fluoride-specific ion channel FluC n=1 Tax=Aliidiomarina minuta TaxID=880057 RepID=A0A432W726_9GAMM|nr:CrcB family protein [Aliidiomarina minuta]RUO25875.1 hypothetical protein CWE09_03875 [Aliidiomarina minuta]
MMSRILPREINPASWRGKLSIAWLVGCGAFIGSAARLLVTLTAYSWLSTDTTSVIWVWVPTLAVNITGSLALGYLASRIASSGQQGLWLLLGVGCLGSYTTFSGFALDIVLIAQHGSWLLMSIYGFSSVLLSIAAAGLGFYWASRHVRT